MKIAAFVFAAGLGTRLYPLTSDKPKALVRLKGVPLLKLVIDKIIASGIDDIVINVHHFADMITDYVRHQAFDARIRISDERAYLRDTAGGLRFGEPLLGQSELLLLHNVDIISSISLPKMIQSHIHSKADVTLAVRKRETSRYLIFDRDNMQLCGWHDNRTGKAIRVIDTQQPTDLAFSGIHVMSRSVVDCIPSVEKSSLIPFYLQSASSLAIRGYRHTQDSWMDVGKYEKYSKILC